MSRTSAAARDAADPLASFRERFVPGDFGAYLDGESLGRPLVATRENLARFVDDRWAPRLIRGWDEGWMDFPTTLGGELPPSATPGWPGSSPIRRPVLWQRGVIPDFRPPQGLRIGLSPLSTSFGEVADGLKVVAPDGEDILLFHCVTGTSDNLMFRQKKASGGIRTVHAKSG